MSVNHNNDAYVQACVSIQGLCAFVPVAECSRVHCLHVSTCMSMIYIKYYYIILLYIYMYMYLCWRFGAESHTVYWLHIHFSHAHTH